MQPGVHTSKRKSSKRGTTKGTSLLPTRQELVLAGFGSGLARFVFASALACPRIVFTDVVAVWPEGTKFRRRVLLCLLDAGREALDVGGLETNLASNCLLTAGPGLSCPGCRRSGLESWGLEKGFSGASGENVISRDIAVRGQLRLT